MAFGNEGFIKTKLLNYVVEKAWAKFSISFENLKSIHYKQRYCIAP
jgi:hypothetical protein